MAERDEFDDIVKRLDLDWSDPGFITAEESSTDDDWDREPAPEPEPETEHVPELDETSDPVDEQFYRRVPERPARPLHRGRVLAWSGVLGSPVLLLVCTVLDVWVSRQLVLGAGLIVVAGSIYLISQLPEHGPSRRDWPDDGAAL